MKPRCHDHPPYAATQTFRDGYHPDGRVRFVEHVDHMSRTCPVVGDVWTREPLVMTRDALGFDCSGCRWNSHEL